MANGRLNLTRDQLATFLKDHQSIKQFELLFSTVDAVAPDFVNEVNIAAENAGSRAQQALDTLQRIADALELLALAPMLVEGEIFENLLPSQPSQQLIDSTLTVNGNLILPAGSGVGLLVDKVNPTYGWNDFLGSIMVRGVAATDPNYVTYNGGLLAYRFDINDQVFIEFHILHDYAPGTDLYLHAHWSHNTAGVTTGSVTWSFEVLYAKGHDQAAFTTAKTVTITQAASTTQYQHMIAEVQATISGGSVTQQDTDDIEIDGLLLVRVSLTANTMDAGAKPFLHMCDIHYQSTGFISKNKSPDFYT
jgi:hypothetical protein